MGIFNKIKESLSSDPMSLLEDLTQNIEKQASSLKKTLDDYLPPPPDTPLIQNIVHEINASSEVAEQDINKQQKKIENQKRIKQHNGFNPLFGRKEDVEILQSIGFITADMLLTPIDSIQDTCLIKSISGFDIIDQKLKKGVLVLKCRRKIPFSSKSLKCDISLYKEGVLLEYSGNEYVFPFGEDTHCTIKKRFRTCTKSGDFCSGGLHTAFRLNDPLDDYYYSCVEKEAIYDTNHYTKDGKLDMRYSSQNRGEVDVLEREHSFYKLDGYTSSIALSDRFNIEFDPHAELESIYQLFRDIYKYQGITIAKLDDFISDDPPAKVPLLTSNEKKALEKLISECGGIEEARRYSSYMDFFSKILNKRLKDLGVDLSDYTSKGQVFIGMRRRHCRDAWGVPLSKICTRNNHTSFKDGVYTNIVDEREIWTYSENRKLIFQNGVLISIEE